MEVPPIKITKSVRAVLLALHQKAGVKLSVQELARTTRLGPHTVRTALSGLEKGKLVQHVLQEHVKDRPPHLVYWITQAGRHVAADQVSKT